MYIYIEDDDIDERAEDSQQVLPYIRFPLSFEFSATAYLDPWSFNFYSSLLSTNID